MVSRTENGIILPPTRQVNIPITAQWLAGQGCGSWFHIEVSSLANVYNISRFSHDGKLEFKAQFKKKQSTHFCIDCPFAFTYLSHYKTCNILQHGEKISFTNLDLL